MPEPCLESLQCPRIFRKMKGRLPSDPSALLDEDVRESKGSDAEIRTWHVAQLQEQVLQSIARNHIEDSLALSIKSVKNLIISTKLSASMSGNGDSVSINTDENNIEGLHSSMVCMLFNAFV